MYQYFFSDIYQNIGGIDIEPVRLPHGRLRKFVIIGTILVILIFGYIFYKIVGVFWTVHKVQSTQVE